MIAVLPPLYFEWRRSLVALMLLLVAVLALYFGTASAMVSIWARSGTFTHAFLVPPIALWLIWEKRGELKDLHPLPDFRWLPVLAVVVVGWLLGDLAAVNAVTQTALVATIIITVPLVLGMPVARRITFPLAFLFFAVPLGEFVMPRLMDWTATVTVLGLRASGIPVHQEGLHFVIPSGRWSVIEACSGVRYLIASLCVGTLFAYLNYRSWRRRTIFVAFAIGVPIVANWVRAYGIVMMGHLSGNELAVGVDHLIYGWFFFGVVIMVMFAVGLRWREDLDPAPAHETPVQPARPDGKPRLMIAAIAGLVVVAAPPLFVAALESADPWPVPAFDHQRLARGGWSLSAAPPISWRPAYSNPTVSQNFVLERDGARVGVHVAYYQQQGYSRKLISSDNKLVKSDDADWALIASGTDIVNVGGRPIPIRTGMLRSQLDSGGGSATRMAVWYWHRVGTQETINDPMAKVRLAVAKLTGRSDSSAAIFVSADEPNQAAALRYLEEAGAGIADMLDNPITAR